MLMNSTSYTEKKKTLKRIHNLDQEERDELRETDVTFFYDPKEKKVEAVIYLNLLGVDLDLTVDDYLLLSAEYDWPKLKRKFTTKRPYRLSKEPNKGGWISYLVEVEITNDGIVASRFLTPKERLYVQKFPELEALFVDNTN